jgi:hypothetical protein
MVCEMTSQEGGCTPLHNRKNAGIEDSALEVSPFSIGHPFLLCIGYLQLHLHLDSAVPISL